MAHATFITTPQCGGCHDSCDGLLCCLRRWTCGPGDIHDSESHSAAAYHVDHQSTVRALADENRHEQRNRSRRRSYTPGPLLVSGHKSSLSSSGEGHPDPLTSPRSK
jgi:hypothetical protein